MALPQLVTDDDIRRTEIEIASRIPVPAEASQHSDASAADFRLALSDRIAPVMQHAPEPEGVHAGSPWMMAPIVLLMAVLIQIAFGTLVPSLWAAAPAAIWIILAIGGVLARRFDISRTLVLMQFTLCLRPLLEGGAGLVLGIASMLLIGTGAFLIERWSEFRTRLESASCDGTGIE